MGVFSALFSRYLGAKISINVLTALATYGVFWVLVYLKRSGTLLEENIPSKNFIFNSLFLLSTLLVPFISILRINLP